MYVSVKGDKSLDRSTVKPPQILILTDAAAAKTPPGLGGMMFYDRREPQQDSFIGHVTIVHLVMAMRIMHRRPFFMCGQLSRSSLFRAFSFFSPFHYSTQTRCGHLQAAPPCYN